MKHLKKLASVLLALVMAAALMMPALAINANGQKANITIANPNGHIFTAYQIFEAQKADNGSLKPESIKWGTYVTDPTAIVDALKTAFPGDVNKGEAGPFDTITDPANQAEDLATILSTQFMNKGPYDNDTARKNLGIAIGGTITKTPPAVSQSVTLNGTVNVGWVLITEQLNAQDTNPTFMLQQITVDETVTRKTQDTGVTKEVFNPDIGTNGDWSDAAIYPIGDEAIDFRLTVALPDNLIADYKNATPQQHYTITLHDVQAAALTDVQISKITLYGKTGNEIMELTKDTDYFVTEGTSHTATEDRPACTFEINIPNVESLTNVEDSGSIVVEYTAKLNGTDIKTGTEGNLNHVELWTDHKISEDNVKVFALELDVNKVDGDGNPLTGAEFTLYKEEDWDANKGEPLKQEDGTTPRPGIPMSKNSDKVIVGEGDNAVEWDAGTRFYVKGLEAGTYYLVESETPDGDYTAIKPIKIVINASTTEKDGPEAGVLTVTVTSDRDRFTESGGIISSTIENIKGTLLPETGGIGTTIFYIVGGVLVVGAVVLLITKRRAGADEE